MDSADRSKNLYLFDSLVLAVELVTFEAEVAEPSAISVMGLGGDGGESAAATVAVVVAVSVVADKSHDADIGNVKRNDVCEDEPTSP